MHEGWLQLLLDGAGPEALRAHRDGLIRSGTDPGPVEQAAQAAFALHSLLEQRRQRATELAALNEIAAQLTTLHDHRALITEIVTQARRLLGADVCYIGLVEPDAIVVNYASGAHTSSLIGMALPFHGGLIGQVVEKGIPARTADYLADPTISHVGRADVAARSEGIRGLLGVPLQVGGTVIGGLLAGSRQKRKFSDDETSLLVALAAHAAVAIDNAQSMGRYREALDEISVVNADLAAHTAELEQTLRWDKALTQIVLQGGGLHDLIAEVSATAHFPAFFVAAPSDVPTELRAHRSAVETLFEHVSSGTGEQTLNVASGDRVVLARPVQAAGDHLGLLLIVAPEADPSALLVLDRASPVIALALTAERAAREATRRTSDAFVLDLLTRTPPTQDEIRQQFRLAGLNINTEYTVVVARSARDVERTRTAVERIAFPSGTVVAGQGSRVILLVPALHPDDVRTRWVQPDTLPTVGIAEPAVGGEGLARAYNEAQQTIDVLDTLGRDSRVVRSRSLGIYRILLSHTGRADLAAVTEEYLGPILREEERKGVPLLETLQSYLNNDRRHAATANELAIHANTLYQRLETIDRLIGTQWREPDQALDLRLLIRLRTSAARLGPARAP
ncbi:GAF domain-containing protein [Antrihabitans sp. YC2-6]|uniref:helix-turn-helix domain-containing protein n=1 Tax=Antrihabitans sp. YC2-6 TaxID=2799498 RepID=UPI0027DB35AF|nr:GAF domain-containing protein [Antrihabitans sp. YC2-6]